MINIKSITKEDAERMAHITEEIQNLVGEFSDLCSKSMSSRDFEDFRRGCLGHIEPALSEDHEWITSNDMSFSKVVEAAMDAVDENEMD